jgi:hypothetical protein
MTNDEKGENDMMACPYLSLKEKSVCEASVSARSLQAEFEPYCTTEEHYRCPTLLGHLLRASRKKAA